MSILSHFIYPSSSSSGIFLIFLHYPSWCFAVLFLLNCLLFITIHDESLSNHICCQFDVIWLFLLSDERVHKPFLKYIHCCSQMFKCFLFFLLCRFCIDIHSGLNILMPHDRLDYFQVRFSFTKPCTKCVSSHRSPKANAWISVFLCL